MGGTALSKSPNGLYIATLSQFATEISIPSVGDTSKVLIPCVEIPDLYATFDVPRLGGIVNVGGKILIAAYEDYDANASRTKSHAFFGSKFAQVGKGGAYTSTYMTYVPEAWKARLGFDVLTGGCCVNIISRTNYGFGLSGLSSSNLTAQELISYPEATPLGPYNAQSLFWNVSTAVGGVVFPDGTSSILFITQQGTTTPCYGTRANCSNTGDSTYAGFHAAPYVTQVVAYDANDLLRVKAGTLAPSAVRPYARWPLSQLTRVPAGAAWDPATSKIYVTERYGADPRVHVYRLTVATTPPPEPEPVQKFSVTVTEPGYTVQPPPVVIPPRTRTLACTLTQGKLTCQ